MAVKHTTGILRQKSKQSNDSGVDRKIVISVGIIMVAPDGRNGCIGDSLNLSMREPANLRRVRVWGIYLSFEQSGRSYMLLYKACSTFMV
jgi:hypothetical protein